VSGVMVSLLWWRSRDSVGKNHPLLPAVHDKAAVTREPLELLV
jgi:hypothetical protein